MACNICCQKTIIKKKKEPFFSPINAKHRQKCYKNTWELNSIIILRKISRAKINQLSLIPIKNIKQTTKKFSDFSKFKLRNQSKDKKLYKIEKDCGFFQHLVNHQVFMKNL